MKTINKITIIVILLTSLSFTAMSQNLDFIPQAKRDSLLMSIAKEAILRYGPDYYREYKLPEIERGRVLPKGEINKTGENANRVYYTVTYFYDKTKEELSYDFSAKVQVWADNHKASGIFFGSGFIKIIPETELRSGEVIKPVIYEQKKVFPIYDWQHGNTEKNSDPVNLDEIKRLGYEKQSDGQWLKVKKDVPPHY